MGCTVQRSDAHNTTQRSAAILTSLQYLAGAFTNSMRPPPPSLHSYAIQASNGHTSPCPTVCVLLFILTTWLPALLLLTWHLLGIWYFCIVGFNKPGGKLLTWYGGTTMRDGQPSSRSKSLMCCCSAACAAAHASRRCCSCKPHTISADKY